MFEGENGLNIDDSDEDIRDFVKKANNSSTD
jgi:hypothetical protein